MLIDVTLKITPKMATDAQGNEKKALVGHLGTHFDVMDKEFPLDYTRRRGLCFDVSDIPASREIGEEAVDLSLVKKKRDVRLLLFRVYEKRRIWFQNLLYRASAAFNEFDRSAAGKGRFDDRNRLRWGAKGDGTHPDGSKVR